MALGDEALTILEDQMNHPHITAALADEHVKDMRAKADAARRAREARRARPGADLLSVWRGTGLLAASNGREAPGARQPAGTALATARRGANSQAPRPSSPAVVCEPTCA